MWEKLAAKLYTAINSLSANHAYLKTLYTMLSEPVCGASI